MVSSALGNALGLTKESTLEELKDSIVTINDYSKVIQTATTDASNTAKSCYRINGSDIDIVPAIGYWGNWNWNESCIHLPKLAVTNGFTLGNHGANSTSAGQTIAVNLALQSVSGLLICAGASNHDTPPGIAAGVSSGNATLKELMNLSQVNYGTAYPASTRVVVYAYSNNSSGVVTVWRNEGNGTIIAAELK